MSRFAERRERRFQAAGEILGATPSPGSSEFPSTTPRLDSGVDDSAALPLEAAESSWKKIESAPKAPDGQRLGPPVFLLGEDGQTIEAQWRESRVFDVLIKRWKPTGYWAVRNGGGVIVPFEPVAWVESLL